MSQDGIDLGDGQAVHAIVGKVAVDVRRYRNGYVINFESDKKMPSKGPLPLAAIKEHCWNEDGSDGRAFYVLGGSSTGPIDLGCALAIAGYHIATQQAMGVKATIIRPLHVDNLNVQAVIDAKAEYDRVVRKKIRIDDPKLRDANQILL